MIWTVILEADGKIRSVRPGLKKGRAFKHQFTVEAPNYEAAKKLADVGAAGRVVEPPPAVFKPKERHPAFAPKSMRWSPLSHPGDRQRHCACGALLGLRETECAVCRHESAKRVEQNKPQSLAVQRTMKRDEAHLRIILEVRERWLKCPNVGAFSKWLNEEVKRLETTMSVPVGELRQLIVNEPVKEEPCVPPLDSAPV